MAMADSKSMALPRSWRLVYSACGLLLFDALFTAVIIARVPCNFSPNFLIIIMSRSCEEVSDPSLNCLGPPILQQPECDVHFLNIIESLSYEAKLVCQCKKCVGKAFALILFVQFSSFLIEVTLSSSLHPSFQPHWLINDFLCLLNLQTRRSIGMPTCHRCACIKETL